ncbi:MAG: hypothetical protein VKJ85_14820, partial [Prochlorothrix sp.]|nr:hypothetical protein [Prochlorothrix sp.]
EPTEPTEPTEPATPSAASPAAASETRPVNMASPAALLGALLPTSPSPHPTDSAPPSAAPVAPDDGSADALHNSLHNALHNAPTAHRHPAFFTQSSKPRYGDLWATPRTPAPLSRDPFPTPQPLAEAKVEESSIVLWVPPDGGTGFRSWRGRIGQILSGDRVGRVLQVGVLVSFGTAVGSILYGWTGQPLTEDAGTPNPSPMDSPAAQQIDRLGVGNSGVADSSIASSSFGAIAPPETQSLLTAFQRIEWQQQANAALASTGNRPAARSGSGQALPPTPIMVDRFYYNQNPGPGTSPNGDPNWVPGTYFPNLGQSDGAGYGSGYPNTGPQGMPFPQPTLGGTSPQTTLSPGLGGSIGTASAPPSVSLPPVPVAALAPDSRLTGRAAFPSDTMLGGRAGIGGGSGTEGAPGVLDSSLGPATPAVPLLMGVLENGNRSLALFKVNGVTQRIAPGEAVGDRGWVLLAVAQGKAIVEYRGRVLALAVGQGL